MRNEVIALVIFLQGSLFLTIGALSANVPPLIFLGYFFSAVVGLISSFVFDGNKS